MKRNKTKKTPRGRTIIKKLKGNTVLLPGGGRYKVGEQVRYSGKGITPIKRKGKVGKVGYSIDDVPDLKDWKPEVGQGMPEVGNGVGFEVGGVGAYMYKPFPDWKWEVTPEPPSAWTSIRAACAGYGRELWDAARWFFALPLRALPDVAGPAAPAPAADVPPLDSFQPAPVADVPAPADVPPAKIPAPDPSRLYVISGEDLAKARRILAKRKRKPRRRKD